MRLCSYADDENSTQETMLKWILVSRRSSGFCDKRSGILLQPKWKSIRNNSLIESLSTGVGYG